VPGDGHAQTMEAWERPDNAKCGVQCFGGGMGSVDFMVQGGRPSEEKVELGVVGEVQGAEVVQMGGGCLGEEVGGVVSYVECGGGVDGGDYFGGAGKWFMDGLVFVCMGEECYAKERERMLVYVHPFTYQ
jgi:hypothetical protein